MRDLVPAFSDDDRLEVRTLEFADVPEAVDELPSLFAESLRKDPPARNGSAERNSNLRRLDSGHARLLAWADIVFVDWCEWAAVRPGTRRSRNGTAGWSDGHRPAC